MFVLHVPESRGWVCPLAALFALASTAGCSTNSGGLSRPGVDPSAAAARAIELYDANKDGSLSQDELAKCPPLATALTTFDTDANGILALDEIEKQLRALCGPTSAYTTYSCTVFLNGRPLDGATVKLRPADFLDGALPPAEGVTDASGMALPTISRDRLPAALAREALVSPGLYHVEITHPTTAVLAKYNEATELGCEVDPNSRSGASGRFDLKSN